MEDETRALLEETVDALLESLWEIRALRRLLTDQGIFSEAQVAAELEKVKNEDYSQLKARIARGALDQAFSKTRRTQ